MKSLSLIFTLFYMLLSLFVSSDRAFSAYSGLPSSGGIELGLPAYPGGRVSDEIYLAGSGMESDWYGPTGNENRMQTISYTTLTQFYSYCNTLENSGYTCVYENDNNGIYAKEFGSADGQYYLYYCEKTHETRIIEEHSATIPSDFGYFNNVGEGVTIYQFDLPYADFDKHSDTTIYSKNGMLYIIRLADNSLVIIDGGSIEQSSDKNIDECMKFLHEITGTTENEKVNISLWFGTHGHSDHITFFYKLLGHYSKQINLERVAFNYPSLSLIMHNPRADMLRTRLPELYPDVKYLNLHTGMTFDIDNLNIEVLYTHEDVVNPYTGKTPVDNPNDASTICRLTAAGKSFIVLGDIDVLGEEQFFRMYDSSVARCDVIQGAHHLYNAVDDFYRYSEAVYVFCPNSRGRVISGKNGYTSLKNYYRDEQLLFADIALYGIELSSDDIKVTKSRSDCGPYDNSSMNEIK